jgi:hypothetical protein
MKLEKLITELSAILQSIIDNELKIDATLTEIH